MLATYVRVFRLLIFDFAISQTTLGLCPRGVMLTSVLDNAKGNAPMLHSRAIPVTPGQAEDVTTGSAHCYLGPLYSPRFGGPGVEIRATQGGSRQGAISVVWDGKSGSEGGRVKLRGLAVTGMVCAFLARHLTDHSTSAQSRRGRCSYERVCPRAQYCAMSRIHVVHDNAKIQSLESPVRKRERETPVNGDLGNKRRVPLKGAHQLRVEQSLDGRCSRTFPGN